MIATNMDAQSFRSVTDLKSTAAPAWAAFLKQGIRDAKNKVQVLPKDPARADSALYRCQVTTHSSMGAIVYETGGLLINYGWIRVLGSGSEKLDRDLMGWNQGKTYSRLGEQLPYLLIADDVLGGFYAINAGGLSNSGIGKVFYLAPENLLWSPTELSYTEFLFFCFSGDLEKYYDKFYWKNWKKDVKKLNGNTGISCYPFLCTVEGQDINKVSRKPVPIEELWLLHSELRKTLVPSTK